MAAQSGSNAMSSNHGNAAYLSSQAAAAAALKQQQQQQQHQQQILEQQKQQYLQRQQLMEQVNGGSPQTKKSLEEVCFCMCFAPKSTFLFLITLLILDVFTSQRLYKGHKFFMNTRRKNKIVKELLLV